MQEQTAGRGPSLLTASPDGRPGPLAPDRLPRRLAGAPRS